MKLDTQVFVSHTKPEPHLIEPIVGNVQDMFWKPRGGGMWTSTLDEEGGEWVRWLRGESYSLDDEHWGGKLWLLEPAEANVFVINDPLDLKELHSRFPARFESASLQRVRAFGLMLDWSAISQAYDAVHIPNPWPYRFGWDGGGDYDLAYSASMFFYVMDAECTCWFRWCFEGEPQLLDPRILREEVNP